MGPRALVRTLLLAALGAPAYAVSDVTLVGDDHLGVVAREVAALEGAPISERDGVYELAVESAGITLRSLAPGEGVTAMADLLHASDIALIVVDATRGPTPVVREHVLVARQARVPMLAILVANVAELFGRAPDEAAEVLDLEIRELRDLLSAYGMGGDVVPVYLDGEPPQPVEGISAFGSRATVLALARFVPRRVRTQAMGSVHRMWGAVYLLSDAEAGGNAVALAPNDAITVWSEGTRATATVDSVSEYRPGDYREMPLTLQAPLRGVEGSRILLVHDERVVGLGAITQIIK